MSNRYQFDAAGNLVHFVHDEPRALVAPENIAAYRADHPDAPEAPPKAPPKAPAAKPATVAAKPAKKATSGRKGGK